MDAQQIGKMVRFHRKKARITQEHLAELAGLGKTVIFDVEKGKMTIQLDTLLKILHVLNIKIEFYSQFMEAFQEQIDEKS